MNFRHFLQNSATPAAKIAAMATAVAIATVALPIATASAGGGHHHRHHRSSGDFVLGGILGLAISAIAEDSNHRRYRRLRRQSHRPYFRPPERLYNEYDPEFAGYDREPRPYSAREPRPIRPYAAREPRPVEQYRNREPAPVQRETLRDSDAPKVITYNETASIEPWSAGWQEYCRTRYRSFNPKSGTFLGYDGDRHFCIAK